MALLRRSGSRFTTNIWPGFVDAMTALLLVLMFVLSIFMIIQSVFLDKISGQETELSRLENEVMNLIADLSLQKEEYKNLNEMNLAINKSSTIFMELGKDIQNKLDWIIIPLFLHKSKFLFVDIFHPAKLILLLEEKITKQFMFKHTCHQLLRVFLKDLFQ